MDASSVSVLWYRKSKPQGKVRRRVQDLRSPLCNFRPELDLSHNESARLAVDGLLSRGLGGYHEVLDAEGEADFLSEEEKEYILEHGGKSDAGTAGPDACDNEDDEAESATQCSAVTTGSDATEAGLGHNGDGAQDEPIVEVYFQSDGRGAAMKDLVRGFIRKATLTLAIVMESFSDVELLCDLLEASRKRNVSVHLLLDHLHLGLFVNMWHDLKLNSKELPKLSVRSVDGQTYCAKTGRKLKGQVTENFIISDWTEVLTGSFSFSWLSWQVHRSFALHLKGGAVTLFHNEFQRLYSSSKPVPDFVTFISPPHCLPLHLTPHAAQRRQMDIHKSKSDPMRLRALPGVDPTRAKKALFSDPVSLEHWLIKTVVNPCTKIHEERLEKNPNQIQTQVPYSKFTDLTITTATDGRNTTNFTQQRSITHQSSLIKNQSPENTGTDGLFSRLRNRNRMTWHSGTSAGPNTQSVQWNLSINFKSKLEPDYPNLHSPPASPQKQAMTGPHFSFNPPSGLQTKFSGLGTWRQAQHQGHHQSSDQSHPQSEAPGPAAPSTKLNEQSAQAKPFSRLSWMLQSRPGRPRPVTRTFSFDTTCGLGQTRVGQPGCRRTEMNALLMRSKSLTERRSAFGVNPNMSKT